MTLEAEQRPVILAVVNALLSVLPDSWTSAQLKLEQTAYDGGVLGCKHSIINPGAKEFVEPSDELYEATGNLSGLFARYGRPWKRAMLEVELAPDGKWDYTIDFDYDGVTDDKRLIV